MAAFRDARVPDRLHCVKDGEAAIAFLPHTGEYSQAPRPDLILLDLNLPKVDEYFAAIRLLKELWLHAASPSPKPDSAA